MAYSRPYFYITAILALLLAGTEAENDFIVILDAGSTGTRAHVFRYPQRVQDADHFPVIVPQSLSVPEELGSYKVVPGISSYSTHPEDLEEYITPIIQKAKYLVLKHNEHANLGRDVPLYLGATAGMRMLDDFLRDNIMSALRDYFMSSRCPFHFSHRGQARVLAGEEEGAFGWLALNLGRGSLSASGATTQGALDLGGASAQISFVPEETSILSNMFPMHMGNFSDGPIHLYTHSFLQYGFLIAFQRSAKGLVEVSYDSHSIDHPCMPLGVMWNTTLGQYGVSTSGGYIEREKGSVMIRGTGNFFQCRALVNGMMYHPMYHSVCPLQPCSIMSVYQPRLGDSKFFAFGEYTSIFEFLNIPVDQDRPLLVMLQDRLESWCSKSLQQQSSATGGAIGTARAKVELSCWTGMWVLELLTSGLGFPINTRNIAWGPDIDWTAGQALYEINFFPFTIAKRVADSTQSKELSENADTFLSKPAAAADSSELMAASPSVAAPASLISYSFIAASGLMIFAAGFLLGRADRRQSISTPGVRTHLFVK